MSEDNKMDMARKLSEQVRRLEEPVDMDALIQNGDLVKDGAWYRVPNPKNLPEALKIRISETKIENNSLAYKFKSEASLQRTLKKLKKAGF